jgi:hypothetical protein
MKMKTSFLIYSFLMMGLIVILTNGCKKDDNNKDGNTTFTSADLVGQWSGTCVKGSNTTNLNFSCNNSFELDGEGNNSEGKLKIRGTWTITSAGKVTGGGYYGYFYGLNYSNAWADWDLQLSISKDKLTGVLDCAVSPFFDSAVVSLSKQ